MTKNTTVDIIVLTYNRINYLKTFIRNLNERTNHPFRLIVVDNGSTDGTRDYILKLKENKEIWKYVFTDKNLPLAAALTSGFKKVESEYFVTVADDMMPCKLGSPCWLDVFYERISNDNNIGSINFVGARLSYNKFLKKNGRDY